MSKPIALRVFLTGLGALALAPAACSFGYQSVYEGDVRFEHCYRLDDEKQTQLLDKQKCWAEWTQRYTYGQTRDRITYALSRQRALSAPAGEGEPPPIRSDVPKPTNASPQPTNAFAPPPQTLVMTTDAGAPDAAEVRLGLVAAAAPASRPGAACSGVCAKDFGACGGACKGETCFASCDERYRSCMRSCF